MYVNTQITRTTYSEYLIQSFIYCFSTDIVFRAWIYEYEDKDLPKLINSILFHLFMTTLQWHQNIKLNTPLFYNLSQAKLQTWAFKLRYIKNIPTQNTEWLLLLAGWCQNVLFGSWKMGILNITALLICMKVYNQGWIYTWNGDSAFRNPEYFCQYIFYGAKLFLN